jgi:hypothetical protein
MSLANGPQLELQDNPLSVFIQLLTDIRTCNVRGYSILFVQLEVAD